MMYWCAYGLQTVVCLLLGNYLLLWTEMHCAVQRQRTLRRSTIVDPSPSGVLGVSARDNFAATEGRLSLPARYCRRPERLRVEGGGEPNELVRRGFEIDVMRVDQGLVLRATSSGISCGLRRLVVVVLLPLLSHHRAPVHASNASHASRAWVSRDADQCAPRTVVHACSERLTAAA
ncbi:hypothetical protein PybrP1_007004 [[Pythium] brassicae (nom. inval.)]|nr:hypothetical protein PybrP1_007004 [[Pythium] brassicae (nom. inval.)]